MAHHLYDLGLPNRWPNKMALYHAVQWLKVDIDPFVNRIESSSFLGLINFRHFPKISVSWS
jgi:hypothetical protein